jgi:hypothetical protein
VQIVPAMFNTDSLKHGPVLYKTYGRTDRLILLHVVDKGKQSVNKFMLLNERAILVVALNE